MPVHAMTTTQGLQIPFEPVTVRPNRALAPLGEASRRQVIEAATEDQAITLILPDLSRMKTANMSRVIFTISKARAYTALPCPAVPHRVAIRPILTAWSPDEVSWENRPVLGAAIHGIASSSPDAFEARYQFDLTELIDAWLDDELLKLGFAIEMGLRAEDAAGLYYYATDPSRRNFASLAPPSVPEPGTPLLLAIGLCILSLLGRRSSCTVHGHD
jgi:hypothetical protein